MSLIPESDQPDRRVCDRRKNSKKYVTQKQLNNLRGRLLLALAFVTLVSCVASYLAVQDGINGRNNVRKQAEKTAAALKDQAHEQALITCLSGGDFRIETAAGFDQLRRLATQGAPDAAKAKFIAQTQPVIDTLLSQAAGVAYHAPLPPGSITASVRTTVRALSNVRCAKRSVVP